MKNLKKKELKEKARKIKLALEGKLEKGRCSQCGEELLFQLSEHDICSDCASRYDEE